MLLYDNEFLPHAQILLENAKSHIRISTFKAELSQKPQGMRLRKFFHTLALKNSQGVQIDFLINKNDNNRSTPRSNIPLIRYLIAHKINVRTLRNNRCCHAKILISDNECAIIGSHNLSIKSCCCNFETSYIIHDEPNLARLTAVYEEAWRSGAAAT